MANDFLFAGVLEFAGGGQPTLYMISCSNSAENRGKYAHGYGGVFLFSIRLHEIVELPSFVLMDGSEGCHLTLQQLAEAKGAEQDNNGHFISHVLALSLRVPNPVHPRSLRQRLLKQQSITARFAMQSLSQHHVQVWHIENGLHQGHGTFWSCNTES